MFNIHKSYITIFILTVLSSTETEHAERTFLFKDVTKLEPLLKSQKKMIKDLEQYIIKESNKLHIFEAHLELLRNELDKAANEGQNYLKDSVKSFLLIKRLSYDLEYLENTSNESMNFERDESQPYPTYEDLDGAVEVLALLLKFNEITATTEELSAEMTASDCYVVANALKNAAAWHKAIEWYLKADEKFDQKTPFAYAFEYVDLADEISFAYYSIDDARNTLKWLKVLTALDPNTISNETREIMKTLEKRVAAENAAAAAGG